MTDLYKPRPDRLIRFRFSLRTMFVLLLVLSIPLAWLGVQMKWVRDRHGAYYGVYFDVVKPGDVIVVRQPLQSGVPWSLRLFGEAEYRSVPVQSTGNAQRDKAALDETQKLFPEATVFLNPKAAPHP